MLSPSTMYINIVPNLDQGRVDAQVGVNVKVNVSGQNSAELSFLLPFKLFLSFRQVFWVFWLFSKIDTGSHGKILSVCGNKNSHLWNKIFENQVIFLLELFIFLKSFFENGFWKDKIIKILARWFVS